jgi:hypothetical protein
MALQEQRLDGFDDMVDNLRARLSSSQQDSQRLYEAATSPIRWGALGRPAAAHPTPACPRDACCLRRDVSRPCPPWATGRLSSKPMHCMLPQCVVRSWLQASGVAALCAGDEAGGVAAGVMSCA